MRIRKKIILFLLIIFSVFYLWYELLFNDGETAYLRFLSLLPMLILLIPGINRSEKNIDSFSPPFLICLSLFFGCFLRVFWLTDGNQNHEILFGLKTQQLAPAIIIFSITSLSFIIGYSSKFIRQSNIPLKKHIYFNDSRLLVLLIFSLLVSFLGALYLLKVTNVTDIITENISQKRRLYDSNGQSNSFVWIRLFAKFTKYSFLLGLCYLCDGRKKEYMNRKIISLLTIISYLFLVTFSFIVSTRTDILYTTILGFMIFIIYGNKIRLRYLLITFFVMITLSNLMVANRSQKSTSSDFVLESLVANHNFMGVVKTALIYDYTYNHNYLYGQSYFSWLFAPIPRSIWKNKPSVLIGKDVRDKIMPTSNLMAGAAPPGFVGEAIWNFGLFGTIIISFFWGLFSRNIFEYLKSITKKVTISNISPFKIILLSIISLEFSLKFAGGSFSQVLINVFEAIIILKLFSLLKPFSWIRILNLK